MRTMLAGAVFVISGLAHGQPLLPKGLKIERHGNELVARTEGTVAAKRLQSTEALDGTWFASLKVGDQIHNFPVAMAQFPATDVYVDSVLAKQTLGDGSYHYSTGLAFGPGPTLIWVPRWEDKFYFCFLTKTDDKFEADCDGEDEPAHLILKPMNGEQPFRFRPVVAHVNALPTKDEETGYLLFNSYQTAVQRNYLATEEGSDILYMNFAVTFANKDAALGIGGVINLGRALEAANGYVPYFTSTLDGRYAVGHFSALPRFERLSAAPLVLQGSDEAAGLHYVISEPEN